MSERIKIKATVNSIAHRGELDELINESGSYTDETLSNFMIHRGFERMFDVGMHQTITEILKERLRVEKEIGEKYDQFSWFGTPTTSIEGGDDDGYFRHFQLGSIFWTPAGGAKEVHGAIRDKYASFGWERSYLGYPTTDELSMQTPDGEVRYSNFRGGTISWTPVRGAYLNPSVDIRTERHQLGGWIYAKGSGFTSNSRVNVLADGLIRRTESLTLGNTYTKGDGRFSDFIYDARIWAGQFEPVTIRAVDVATGAFATGTTHAFTDRQ
jgi:hypothetical protein